MRREGLYSSHLTTWRSERERGDLAGPTAARKRGPVPRLRDPRDQRIAELERTITLWRKRAERAEVLIEVPKNIAALLGKCATHPALLIATMTSVGGSRLGIAPTCAALGVPRATYYRTGGGPRTPRRVADRLLAPSPTAERLAVLAVLHEPRFVDLVPAEVGHTSRTTTRSRRPSSRR